MQDNRKGDFKMMKKVIHFFKDEEGATMVEYALMVALIAAVCVGAVTLLGGNANTSFTNSANNIIAP
jgi:pilus assembly protein Flp/PilA